ncbi:hypothetical protein BLNAU_7900 [Blattamonas nauphoetae]|uniref:Uncharacterized protein n=1 Tax=Blattamonas nauphoetae TaxID=2049346 RepID=A0ABQ9Y024_9EUKA|nr:hypothetical protein BLNAU_7900 [Blattamonas nauphoetae]
MTNHRMDRKDFPKSSATFVWVREGPSRRRDLPHRSLLRPRSLLPRSSVASTHPAQLLSGWVLIQCFAFGMQMGLHYHPRPCPDWPKERSCPFGHDSAKVRAIGNVQRGDWRQLVLSATAPFSSNPSNRVTRSCLCSQPVQERRVCFEGGFGWECWYAKEIALLNLSAETPTSVRTLQRDVGQFRMCLAGWVSGQSSDAVSSVSPLRRYVLAGSDQTGSDNPDSVIREAVSEWSMICVPSSQSLCATFASKGCECADWETLVWNHIGLRDTSAAVWGRTCTLAVWETDHLSSEPIVERQCECFVG